MVQTPARTDDHVTGVLARKNIRMSTAWFFSSWTGHQKVVPSLLCEHCKIVSSSKTTFWHLTSSFSLIFTSSTFKEICCLAFLCFFFFFSLAIYFSLFSYFFLPRLKIRKYYISSQRFLARIHSYF